MSGNVCPGRGCVCPGDGYPPFPKEGIWDPGKPPPPPPRRDIRPGIPNQLEERLGLGITTPKREIGPGIPLDRQTCENITFPQLRRRMVNFFSMVSLQPIIQYTLLQSFEEGASPQDPLIKHWIVICVCACVWSFFLAPHNKSVASTA